MNLDDLRCRGLPRRLCCHMYYCCSTMYGVIYLHACLGGKLVFCFLIYFFDEYKLALIPIFRASWISMYINWICR